MAITLSDVALGGKADIAQTHTLRCSADSPRT